MSDRRHPSEHVDHVKHDWSNLRQELIARLPADDERAGKGGDYSHFSEPHSMDECPFRDSPLIEARR